MKVRCKKGIHLKEKYSDTCDCDSLSSHIVPILGQELVYVKNIQRAVKKLKDKIPEDYTAKEFRDRIDKIFGPELNGSDLKSGGKD